MEVLNHTRRGAVTAALALSLSALVAGAASAQTPSQPSNPNPPAQNQGTNTGSGSSSGPSSLNPGGVQGRQSGTGEMGTPGSQTQGTPSGAAAQGNTATQGGSPAYRPAPGSSRVQVSSSNGLSSILARAQDMLRVARARQADAPSGARQSYKASAQALHHMLTTAGYGSSSSSALPALGTSTKTRGVSVSLSTMPVSSEQITQDIQTLRWMAKQGSHSGSGLSKADMQQVASLYATGAKEFFTGQLREALFQSPVTVSARNNAPIPDELPNTGAVLTRRPGENVPFPITLQQPNSGNDTANVLPGIVPAGDPSQLPPQGGPAAPVVPAGGPYIAPNVQFAPPVNYGGYLFGPSALILNGYAPTAGFNGIYPYVPFF